jgi:hypothetical protein
VLRERVADLRELSGYDAKGTESERAVVALYERSLDRTGRLLHELARLDLDARLAVLEHARARLVLGLILRVLEARDLNLDASQLGIARTLVAAELRALNPEVAT